MASTMTVNSVTVPQPAVDGVKFTKEAIGQQRRMASGALKGDIVVQKRRVTVQWVGLSATERATLEGTHDMALVAGTHPIVLPNGVTFSAQIVFGSWDEAQWYDQGGNPYYDITIAWMEA